MTNTGKNKLTLGLIAAISATLLFTATDSLAEGHHKDRIKMLFKRIDTDNNRAISLDELMAPALKKAEKRFIRRDIDQDGFLTFEEMTAGKDRPDLSEIADEIVQCVADIKEATGSDNIIVPDASRFISAQQKFDNMDSSGDALLDLEEVLSAATAKVSNHFTFMDKDGIDDVSLREFALFKKQQLATKRAVKACVSELLDDDEF